MRNWREVGILPILLVILIANARDLTRDLAHGAGLFHLFEEGLVTLVTFVALAWLIRRFWRQRRELEALRRELCAPRPTRPAPDRLLWARRQLGDAIQDQFELWGLTASEKEIGLLLLKGLSLKEIAALRDTAEKTVRQQASTLYKKSGLAGRHAFAAWFFEDLLSAPPADRRAEAHRPGEDDGLGSTGPLPRPRTAPKGPVLSR